MVFLNLVPNYLTQEKGITALKAGFMTTVPFLAAFVGVLLSGWVAHFSLVRKGFSLGFARKTPIYLRLADLHLHYGCELHQRSDDDYVPDGAGILRQRFCFDYLVAGLSLAPMRLIGLTGGVFNFAGASRAASPFRWWWGTWRRVTVSHLHWFISPPSR